ncbi:PorT family protein [Fulvivirga ligni]|uniref:PorT family protein n=1 Tax=Fulvivirga ligni TaxID=2904246 RepID=UPI001F166232|nr:PorT family protein [Fulvivirga ligni]UII22251.1 PorT family protein [Fulvivirga ligni]
MKKLFSSCALILFSVCVHAQITFDPGYIIDNQGNKTACLIRNVDWKNNPTSFEYKMSDESQTQLAVIDSVSEFGISDSWKYIRATVDIDRSSSNLGSLSKTKEPEFQKETLFLQYLIEGKATLYQYTAESNLTRFYYQLEGKEIEPLIYKSYSVGSNNYAENNKFRQQLFVYLKCESIDQRRLENLDYKKRDLTSLFTDYNNCSNSDNVNYVAKDKDKRDFLNLTIRPGVNFSKLDVSNRYFKSVSFDPKTNFRLGLLLEFVLPFNQNKWAITLEPTYQYYKEDQIVTEYYQDSEYHVDYKSIELPIGLSHSFYLNDDTRFFASANYVLNFDSKDSYIKKDRSTTLEVTSGNSLAFSGGFQWKPLSLEIRYMTSRNILLKYNYWDSEYSTVSFIVGYKIF